MLLFFHGQIPTPRIFSKNISFGRGRLPLERTGVEIQDIEVNTKLTLRSDTYQKIMWQILLCTKVMMFHIYCVPFESFLFCKLIG